MSVETHITPFIADEWLTSREIWEAAGGFWRCATIKIVLNRMYHNGEIERDQAPIPSGFEHIYRRKQP